VHPNPPNTEAYSCVPVWVCIKNQTVTNGLLPENSGLKL
jgi:hypothetical protein